MLREVLYYIFDVTYRLHIHAKHIVRRPAATVIFIHGLGDSGAMWDNLVAQLPSKVNYLVVDLLGFGKSAYPKWTSYSVHTQALSIAKTCKKTKLPGPYILVGHSLGSLVAVEFALNFPKKVKRLILCAPPIYRGQASDDITPSKQETLLHTLYEAMLRRPNDLARAWKIAKKLGVIKESAQINDSTLRALTESLRLSIMSQNTRKDILKVTKPITIIRGAFDPLVIGANIQRAAAQKPTIKIVTIPASHIVNKRYEKEILRALTAAQPTGQTKQSNQP